LRVSGAARRRLPAQRCAVPAVLAAAALVVVAGNAAGRPGLAVAVIALQAVLGVAWLVLLASTREAAIIVGIAVTAADVVLLRTRAATAGSIVGVIGLSVIAVLFHQLARRDPRGVTGAVSVTLSAIVLTLALALLLPLRELAGGRSAVFTGIVTAAAAVVVVRLLGGGADPLRRLAGLLAAVLVALACGLAKGGLTTGDAIGLGLGAAVTALLADRMLARVTVPQTGGGLLQAYSSMIVPVTAILPLALASPIAYLAGRVIASGAG
jgi:hypothetical protein